MVLKPPGAAQTPKTDPQNSGQTAFRYPDQVFYRLDTDLKLDFGFAAFVGPGSPGGMGFIGFGAMDVTKPYKFIGFGALGTTKPYKFIGLGDGLLARRA